MEKNLIKIQEQEEIISLNGKNMIVSASAGSGKTSVMIRKIYNYIEGGLCHVDELLVLTYTKAAAMEMKKKLIDKMRASNNDKIMEELEDIYFADISTFDSFCQKLVKRYFYVLGIDPAFNILEGSEKLYQQQVAITRAIKKIKASDPNAYEVLMQSFSTKRDEEKIKDIIFDVYNYSTSILNLDEFYQKIQNLYKKESKIAENFLKTHFKYIFEQTCTHLEYLKDQCVKLNFDKYTSYISNLLVQVEKMLFAQEFTQMIDICETLEYGKLYKEAKDEIGFREIIAGVRDDFKKTVVEIEEKFISSEEVAWSYENCGILIESILKLLIEFNKQYESIKNKLNSYDFNDIERLTIKLLENDSVNQEIKNSYKYIFVDEFQDANALQERIVNLLQNNNLFFVGDTKQSIYAFRQSDPEIFLNIQKKFQNDPNGAAKFLNCNFRTNKNILEFVNSIFSKIMTPKTTGVDYKKDAMFDPRAVYEDVDNEICVSVNLLNGENNKTQKQEIVEVYNLVNNECDGEEINKYNNECDFICEQIGELIGTNIYDKELQKERRLELKDITILVAKRGSFVDCLVGHFEELGIPYTVDVGDNIENQRDNLVLFNLMKYSLNSLDDYSLYSILSSNLFDFTNDELAKIKYDTEAIYFYDAVKQYEKKDDVIANKLREFEKTINNFKFDIKYNGIYYSLSKIIRDTNYILKINDDEEFSRRNADIGTYVDSFLNSKFNYDLCGYINFREKNSREEIIAAKSSVSNSVKIATMHSSKGLEYPVVILPNLDQDFNGPNNNCEIKIAKDLGIGVKAYNTEERTRCNGIFYEACRLNNLLTERSEKIRLLYVAMTRAKNKLILIGKNGQKFGQLKNDLQILSQNSFLNLIVGALDENIIKRINSGEDFNATLYENKKINLNCKKVQTLEIRQKSIIIPKQSEKKHYKVISDFLNKDLKLKWKNIALKNSVSGFAFDENSSINLAPVKLSIDEHLKESNSDMGTLYHLLLEKMDFNTIDSPSRIEEFVLYNFDDGQRQIIHEFGYDKIYENIKLLKEQIKQDCTVLKEQKFVMRVPHKEIIDGGYDDKILVQGVIDLLIIKKDKILLIDYKLTSKSENEIIKKYKKQLELYKLAVSKIFKDKQIDCYILNLKKYALIPLK